MLVFFSRELWKEDFVWFSVFCVFLHSFFHWFYLYACEYWNQLSSAQLQRKGYSHFGCCTLRKERALAEMLPWLGQLLLIKKPLDLIQPSCHPLPLPSTKYSFIYLWKLAHFLYTLHLPTMWQWLRLFACLALRQLLSLEDEGSQLTWWPNNWFVFSDSW